MKLRVVIAEAWRSLTASLSTTLAAALTVLIGMFLVGLLIGLGTWARSWSEHQKGQLDINVYLCTTTTCGSEVTTAQRNAIRVRLQNDPRIGSEGVEYISKEQALEKMKKTAPDMVSGLVTNPLPDAFKITPRHGEDVVAIASNLNKNPPPGVEKVNYGKTYQGIIRRGKVMAARETLLLQGETRFGPPPRTIRQKIESMVSYPYLRLLLLITDPQKYPGKKSKRTKLLLLLKW